MSFLGADTDELRGAADECMQGKEVTDQVIQYLQALIALLKAASFFSGGASAAYAEYLETVVVPWLQKISQALELFAKVLGANAEAQDQASQGETVDAGSLPSYTSQVSGDSSVQPFNGSVLGSGSNAGAAFGAITGAATGSPGRSSATPTSVTVTSPDGTVTTIGPGASTDTGGAAGTTPMTTAPVTTTPISATTTDGVIARAAASPASAAPTCATATAARGCRPAADRAPAVVAAAAARWPRPAPAAASARARSTAASVPAPTPARSPTPAPARPRCTAAWAPAGARPARTR